MSRRDEAAARVMRKATVPAAGAPQASGAASSWRDRLTGGAPLPGGVRARMEPQLGADLSGVKVHTDGNAASAASQLGARAFTMGNDVHFGSGEFAPGTKEGDRLIAHELTHVVQGHCSGIQRKVEEGDGGGDDASAGDQLSQPGDAAEVEADKTADHVADQLHGADEKGAGAQHGSAKPHGPGDGDALTGHDDKEGAAGGHEAPAHRPAQPAPKIAAKLSGAATIMRAPAVTAKTGPTTAPTAAAKTKAARKKITRFLKKTFKQKNYVTANGYGAFDLKYEPSKSECTVTVKLEFKFEDAPPSVWMKYLPITGDVSKLPDCSWTKAKKEAFEKDMAAQVDRVWSGQHLLKCSYKDPDLNDMMSPTWDELSANVKCVVKPVKSGGHFKVKVIALPKADSLRSFVQSKDHHKKAGAVGTAGPVKSKDFKKTTATFNSSDNASSSIPSSLGGPNTNQVTTAHEFGHMLGQDDQYTSSGGAGTTNDSGSKRSSVPADEQRIMDGGEKVLEEHYSTIVDALNNSTKPVTFGF
jgi:hypothetical protein